MSYFGETLARLMAENAIPSGMHLARTSGVNNSKISRIINGQQTYVDLTDLARICAAISTHDVHRAELIRAHLLDECQGPGADLIDIRIRGARDETSGPPQHRLSKDIEDALALLRAKIPHNEDLKQLLIRLSKAL